MSDVPAQITLYPPTTDVETSHWVGLAPTLWHAGLIWRDYEQVVFDLASIELRILCTFTDRHAFASWQHHAFVNARCPEVLASPIDLVEVRTPLARHDPACTCDSSSALILTGHGFGNRKFVLTCTDCLGYYPNYRVLALLETMYASLQSWSLVFGHVFDIWKQTSDLEEWALNELQAVDSELNTAGQMFAKQIRERTGRPTWYFLFVPAESRTAACPCCHDACTHPRWSASLHLRPLPTDLLTTVDGLRSSRELLDVESGRAPAGRGNEVTTAPAGEPSRSTEPRIGGAWDVPGTSTRSARCPSSFSWTPVDVRPSTLSAGIYGTTSRMDDRTIPWSTLPSHRAWCGNSSSR